ncbi:MAG TPA: ImmA/IrrE family metallo-endopeptidase [Armatimonadota bacterium]|jgi:hypothetical protein
MGLTQIAAAPNRRQLGRRPERLLQIEQAAFELLTKHEALCGGLQGCVVATELLVETAGCELCFFNESDRESLGIPPQAIGYYCPPSPVIYVRAGLQPSGRENQTIGEELGHHILHAVLVTSHPIGLPGPSPVGFTRLPPEAQSEVKQEPEWMSQEAAFFSACLQMPSDRYLPAAKAALVWAWRKHCPSEYRSDLEGRLKVAQDTLRWHSGQGDQIIQRTLRDYGILCGSQVHEALGRLQAQHRGAVSKQAQIRRMIELGLLHDLADLLGNIPRVALWPRWTHLVMSDSVVRQAEGGRMA